MTDRVILKITREPLLNVLREFAHAADPQRQRELGPVRERQQPVPVRIRNAAKIAPLTATEAEASDDSLKAGRHLAPPRDERPQDALGGIQVIETQAVNGERQKLPQGTELLRAARFVAEADRLFEMT